jgi:hypothetical protein
VTLAPPPYLPGGGGLGSRSEQSRDTKRLHLGQPLSDRRDVARGGGIDHSDGREAREALEAPGPPNGHPIVTRAAERARLPRPRAPAPALHKPGQLSCRDSRVKSEPL